MTDVVASTSFSVDGTGMLSAAKRRSETASCVIDPNTAATEYDATHR